MAIELIGERTFGTEWGWGRKIINPRERCARVWPGLLQPRRSHALAFGSRLGAALKDLKGPTLRVSRTSRTHHLAGRRNREASAAFVVVTPGRGTRITSCPASGIPESQALPPSQTPMPSCPPPCPLFSLPLYPLPSPSPSTPFLPPPSPFPSPPPASTVHHPDNTCHSLERIIHAGMH